MAGYSHKSANGSPGISFGRIEHRRPRPYHPTLHSKNYWTMTILFVAILL